MINETGNPLDEIIEKMQQLGNLGEWNPWGSAWNRKKPADWAFDTTWWPQARIKIPGRDAEIRAAIHDLFQASVSYILLSTLPW